MKKHYFQFTIFDCALIAFTLLVAGVSLAFMALNEINVPLTILVVFSIWSAVSKLRTAFVRTTDPMTSNGTPEEGNSAHI